MWEKPDADGRGNGIYDFIRLMGTGKKILLEKLPSMLDGVITPPTCGTEIKLWKDLNHIYKDCTNMKAPTDLDIDTYFSKVTVWVTLYLSLGGMQESMVKPILHHTYTRDGLPCASFHENAQWNKTVFRTRCREVER